MRAHNFISSLFVFILTSTLFADNRPNFIFLLVDDWGWKDAGCLGSDLYETPHIDDLAATGTSFRTTYAACTVCSPTRAAVLTGMYPGRTRVTDWITGHVRKNAKLQIPNWTQWLEHRHTTIAEALKSSGYATAHVGKWHLVPRKNGVRDYAKYLPDQHGFDINIAGNEWGAPGSYFHPFGGRRNRPMYPLPAGGEPGDYLTDRLTNEAIKIIHRFQEKPFFLYFPYYTVHTPIESKKENTEKYQKKIAATSPQPRHRHAKYAGMVHSLDESIGRILACLDELKLTDNTVIFLTGDNGGLDRGARGPTDNFPIRAGKGSAYEGGVRVPGIIRWPGVTRSGAVCDTPIISCDFYPTILEIADVAGDANHNKHVDGVSIVNLLRSPAAKLTRDLFWHYPHYHPGGSTPHSAIRSHDFRLVEFFEDDRVELYHLAEDIGENNDLAAKLPDQVTELRRKLDDWRTQVDAQLPTLK